MNIGDKICAGAFGCTLRAAIQETNACNGADFIEIPAGIYNLSVAGTGEDAAATGDLDITSPLTISGTDRASVVDGNGNDRVFHSLANGPVIFSGLTIRNGNASDWPGGGGVLAATAPFGSMSLSNCEVTGNSTPYYGGGINNHVALTVDTSVVSNNTSSTVDPYGGGGIEAGSLTVRDSTISGNITVAGYGGGVECGSCSFYRSVISGNTAGINGGGINMASGGWIENSTITGNSAAFGGAVYFGGGNGVVNSTITSNTGSSGAGGFHLGFTTIPMVNSILAANTGPDCAGVGTLQSDGHNIDDDNSCGLSGAGDMPGTISPVIASGAGYNGGPTQTHALQAGSPAIDAGDNANCPATDQRGVARSDGACDIGAYEYP
ncbi:MAG: choice-of-anchor Q domain-containing protein [Thermodesulfobacteriota bacterium]